MERKKEGRRRLWKHKGSGKEEESELYIIVGVWTEGKLTWTGGLPMRESVGK